MRVVYEVSGVGPVSRAAAVPPLPPVERGKFRDVIVVRVGARDDAAGPGRADRPGDATRFVLDEDAAAARDAVVRSHEKAHLSALGPYAASLVDYSTVKGADGRAYATGGSIKVDLSPVPGDPEASLRKARAVLAAAEAPGDPSAADRAVAAKAYRLMRDAARELRSERTGSDGTPPPLGSFEAYA